MYTVRKSPKTSCLLLHLSVCNLWTKHDQALNMQTVAGHMRLACACTLQKHLVWFGIMVHVFQREARHCSAVNGRQ